MKTMIELDAAFLLMEIRAALARGTKHFRVSDGALLNTPKEILEALLNEGEITFEPTKENPHGTGSTKN